MGDFSRNRGSGGRRFEGGRNFRGRDSGPRQMHKAVCDNCGNNCEVPFRPSGDKPIYCSDCFEKMGGGNSRGGDRNRSRESNFGERDNSNKQLLDQVTLLNTKLDRVVNFLETIATGETPSMKAKEIEGIDKLKTKDKKVRVKKETKKKAKKVTK